MPLTSPSPTSPLPPRWGLLALALLALILYTPAFLDALRLAQPLGGGGGDVQLQFFSWRDRDFSRVASGELPLLDPLVFAGQSVPGNWQRAIFYPPNLLHLFLPTALAITTLAFLHTLLAGVLTFGWLRSKELHTWAATLGAAAFMCSGVYLGRAFPGHLTWLAVAAWSPAVFWTLDRLLDTGRLRPALWAALAVAMMLLGGYPQPAYITLVAAALYLLLMFLESPHRLRAVLGFALMFVLGVTLAAPAVLPGLEAATESVRAGALPFDVAARHALPLSHLLLPFAPLAFGGLSSPTAALPWETHFYFGAIPAVLALTAAAFAHTPARRRALTMVVIFTLLALGPAMPLFRIVYELLPFASGLRVPARWLLPVVLFASVLAATAFDALLRGDRRATLVARVALALTGVVMLSLGFFAPTSWFPAGIWQMALVPAGLLLAFGAAIPLLISNVRLPPRFGLPALGLLALAELAYFSRPFVVTSPPAPALSSAVLAALRAVPTDTRVQLLHPDLANAPASLGLPVALAYDPFMPRRLAELLAAAQGIDPRDAADLSPALKPDANETILRLLRVSRLIAPDGTYRTIADPLPRALLVPQADIQPIPALTLARLVSPTFDPAARVLLESRPVFPPAADPGRDAPDVGPDRAAATPTTAAATLPTAYTARITAAPRPERLEVAVTVPRHAFLLITDAYSPAWSARRTDTDTPLSVMPADHALLAIPVPPGEYTVELTYRPRTLTTGLALAAIGATVWLIALTRTKNRRTPSLTPAGQVE